MSLDYAVFLAKENGKKSVTISLKEAESIIKHLHDLDFTISWLMDRVNEADHAKFCEWVVSGMPISELTKE